MATRIAATIRNTSSPMTSSSLGGALRLLWVVVAASTVGSATSQEQTHVFGTQCSFAVTGPSLDGCNPDILDHRQLFYDEFIHGCYERFSEEECDREEGERHVMNEEQPQSMVNMTATGYQKTKAPASVLKLLTEFWEANKDKKEPEEWGPGSIYVNHWESPSFVVDIGDEDLEGGGEALKEAIWNAAIDGIAEWTGKVAKLRPVSLYGIREYTEGAILAPHVDRIPLVSSGIVNVAQDVDEPWPLEVYDRNGHAVNITLEPGEMILYESHSLIHGRPYPLKGRSYANVFIHFEPFDGWDEARDNTNTKMGLAHGDLPPYLIPGSPSDQVFREDFPNGWSSFYTPGEEPPVHQYAAEGELEELQKLAKIDPEMLRWKDDNGWTPMHEAARNGHNGIIAYLLEMGASVNDPSTDMTSPLRAAINRLGEDHDVVAFLKSLGAEDHGEEFDESDRGDEEDEFDEEF